MKKHQSLFSPADFLDYQRKCGACPDIPPPGSIILCYNRQLVEHVKKKYTVTPWDGVKPEVLMFDDCKGKIGICGPIGIGAPMTVTVMEELIAHGVKRLVSIGTAGTLQKLLQIGDTVLVDKAIRDEGTSHHYLATDKYAEASPALASALGNVLKSNNKAFCVGCSWTTDAPYRETVEEVEAYQDEGVLTVEMELAALFAVGQYRGVDVAGLLTISDTLADLEWHPEFHADKTKNGLELLL